MEYTLTANNPEQDENELRQPVILLHGLFGNLSNWKAVQDVFSADYNLYTPLLPLFDTVLGRNRLDRLVVFLEKYILDHNIQNPILIGNSLGGHVALLYTLKHPDKVSKLVLTGSSGLYENSFGGGFPRVKDYNYIRKKVEDVFDRKEVVNAEVVDSVYSIVQNNSKVIAVISLARDAQRQNLKDRLAEIKIPVLLIWGLQDIVTPPEVAREFHTLIPHSKLHLIDECGHVPMMEQPILFNQYLKVFLSK
ncbi:alpha/beta fold hydrolase [Flavobacterium kingsejongi]|uniref:Alpha/beta hydrolase n=1 Tax=Flavobacterium kingsejongi TaxID=1678728 RepID=A0A2S1LU94_9FLAO|nr:alpha/beta hydrolase [Flavobacterium kingsejongi]AWG27327.1 alpha/beta hydrolase [Flavobacterium kingsejongi]